MGGGSDYGSGGSSGGGYGKFWLIQISHSSPVEYICQKKLF